MKRTMKQLTAFMLALLLLAGQMTSALAATSEGVGLDVAPYAVEGSAERLDFDPYSDYVENEIYVTDEYLHPYPDDHEFVTGDKLRFNIRFELEKSDALYGYWFNSSECTYAIREAYRQGYFWGGKPTSLPQIDETTVFTIPFAGLGNIVGANLPWSYAQRQDGLIQQSSNVAFQWWLDKENEKVCLVFTKNALDGVSGYEALSNLYINVSGELDASALQGENTADFTVGNVDISLPLAAKCVPVKSAVMEYDAATGNYVAHYTITLDLNRDVNLSEVALNVLDTRTEGTIIGAPQNVSVTSATGDDVSVTFAAVDGLSTRFDLASSDSILTKGSYTITYSAPLTKTYDELFSQNGSGFNALNYDQKTNTAQVYKGDTPTGNTSSATLTYTAPSQTTALSKEVYQDYTNSSYINGIYEVRDQNGVTEYYATFYVDARIQNEANSLTITDDAGQWLSHINESPVVLYTQAGLVDWINPDALTTPENVSVIYNDNGNVRTFTVSGNPLQPGAYRLMYRMKVKPEAVKEALSSGKDLSIVNTAALTKLDAFPIEDRSDDAAITLPSYTKSAKSYQIITLDDGSKLVQWQIAFRWNFFQKEGDSQIVDTLSGGNYFVSAEYPMTILNNYQQVASITDITKAGDYGVAFAADGSSFTYTLGESGNYNEKTNNIYIITYYTQLEEADESGVIPTQTNSYETKYSFDNTTGGDSGTVVVNTEAEEEPDTPVDPDKPDPDEPTETPIRISPIKAVLSSSFDRASQAFFIKWEVAAELGQLPYERVESFVITDIIPDDMLDYMDITAVDVVVRSADWGPLIPLTENQHYTVEKTSDDRWAVSLNVAAVYETMPNAQWIGANFTTKAQQLPQGMSQCHNNSAELHYTYGDFDITTTCTQGNWYQASKPEKTGWLQNQDVYNSATGEYVYNQDGVGDIVWQIALKDANFLNRGETTAVSVADTLPTIALPSGETVTMMEILENTLRIQSVGHGNSGTKIENFTLQNNGPTFTLTFDVPADWPADSVYILYCCQLTDDYAASLNGDTYVPNVTNTANATWDNYTDHITGTSAMNVVDNRLMKSGTVAVDRSRINYTLSINPRKFDLSADSDVVLVTDALNNTNVTYLQNSFVLKDSAGNVLTRAAAASASTYHLKFSSDGSSFQLEVPDNTSLVLTYSVEPTIEVGHETGSIGNTAQTAGITKYHQINSFRADISSAGASTAVLLDGQRGVVVFKNDSETDMPLDGAEFTIYKVNSDLTETATAKTGVSAGGRILFRFTATEEGLGFDQVYCLRETKAPAGYAKSDEAWYFYFAQADKNGDEITPSTETQAILDALAAKDIPVTADAASKTYTFTAKNTPVTTADFTFTKVDENEVALDGAVFTLVDSEGAAVAAKENTETGVFTYEGLTVGAYVLTEISAPEGYELPENASWRVTVAEDGTVTVNGEGFDADKNSITNVKTPEPEPITATFTFTKVDENGAALDGAVFTLTNANSETIPAKADTAIGVFTYEALPVGTYTLTETAAPEGYDLPANTSWTVTVAEDGTITVTGESFNTTDNTITNVKTPEPEPVTATFSFTKVDENGAALDGASFTLTNAEGTSVPAKADTAIGVFTYEALPVGTYTLTETAAPEGYDLPANTSWTVTIAEDGTITVTGEGFTTTDSTITNTKTPEPEPVTATFSFKKVDENGAALDGASFTLTNANSETIPAKADTAIGVFTYEALPVGTYTLTETAAPEGYDLPANTTWTVTVAEDGTITVTGEGFNTTDNTITNVKTPEPEPVTATFTFTKVDENGAALDGAVFTLTNANSETIPAKADTAIGVFTYEALPVGTYTLTETAAPEGYDLPANTSWTVTVAEDGTITVTGEGFNTTDNTITNTKTPEPEPITATFTFTKVDENGAALDGAVFTLTNANSETIPAKSDTATGVFTYEGLTVGAYVLTEISAPEGYELPANTIWTVTVADDGTITVTGEGFNTTDSTITNVKTPEPEPVTATFTFTKVDENGAALDGAVFTLTNANSETVPAKANTATGVFTYEALPVGSYTLTETAAPEGFDLPANTSWTVTVAEDGTVTVNGEGFDADKNSITNVKTPEPEPVTATFSFTKVDENGAALDGAVFTLTNANSETIPAKADTATGVFTYEALPAGTYTLTETAAPEGYELPANTSWTVTVADDGTITVTGEGFNTADSTIINTKSPEPVTATFSFTKVDENGAALDGASFTLTNAEGTSIPAKADTAIGVFTYEALPVGTYTLTETAAPEGYDLPANTSWTVTVAEDGTITATGEGFNTADSTITNTKTPEPEPITATFSFTKVDENGAALDGASFTLTNAEGTSIPAKADTATGVFTYEGLTVGSYTLTETAAPEGYELPANTTWTVTVAEDGTITVTGEGFNTADSTITNTKTPEPEPVTATFSFKKVDENGIALLGATFTLTNADGQQIFPKAGEPAAVFTYVNLPVGVYTLEETKAPAGYDLPENAVWTVTVAEDGTVSVTGDCFNTENNTIVNARTRFSLSLTKVDGANSGKKLKGARFSLSGTDYKQIQTTGADGRVTFTGLLPGRYTLLEEKAPDGYLRSSTYQWKVTVYASGRIDVGAKQDVKNTLTIVNHKEGDIAQTGPVTWPKTLMLLLGGALYVTGLLLILPAMYKKRTRHED